MEHDTSGARIDCKQGVMLTTSLRWLPGSGCTRAARVHLRRGADHQSYMDCGGAVSRAQAVQVVETERGEEVVVVHVLFRGLRMLRDAKSHLSRLFRVLLL